MKTLPANLVLQKNKLSQPEAWLLFLDILLPDSTYIYLVRNTENVTWNGHEYQATEFTLEATKTSSKGEIPTVTLGVSNVTRMLQTYLEELSGGVGSVVTISLVNAAHLNEDYTELQMTFDVQATQADAHYVTFTLGAPNPMRSRFPNLRYIANHCGWQFNYPAGTDLRCGYTGTLTTCNRTLDDCRARGNGTRFGGFIGLGNIGVRLA